MNYRHSFAKVLGIAIALGSIPAIIPALPSAVVAQSTPPAQLDTNLLFNRGVQKLEQQDYEGAIASFGTLIEREPSNANAYLGRAIAYRNQGKFAKAIQDYDKSIALNPTNANAYFGRAITKHNSQNARDAIEDYSSAIRYNNDYGQAYYNRAISKNQIGDREGALADFRRAAEIYREQELIQYYQDAIARIAEMQAR